MRMSASRCFISDQKSFLVNPIDLIPQRMYEAWHHPRRTATSVLIPEFWCIGFIDRIPHLHRALKHFWLRVAAVALLLITQGQGEAHLEAVLVASMMRRSRNPWKSLSKGLSQEVSPHLTTSSLFPPFYRILPPSPPEFRSDSSFHFKSFYVNIFWISN